MDDALQQAHRQALARPDDPATRRAYSQQLLRVGHKAAALHELFAACDEDDPDYGGGEFQLGLLTSMRPLPGDDRRAVARPDRSDPRFPWAGIGLVGDVPLPAGPLLLYELPACAGCGADAGAGRFRPQHPPRARGVQPCAACEGTGTIVEFTGRAEDHYPCDRCGQTGLVVCEDCDGSTIPDLDPAAVPGPCACGEPLEVEFAWVAWETPPSGTARGVWLGRCPGCGLGALRRRAGWTWTWACQACGWLACRCP